MEAKLIKTDVNYLLEDNKGVVIGSTSTKEINKLSKQNCDEIFGVVDVEKLAIDIWKDLGVFTENDKHLWFGGFRNGFNKAMELNKDKVFTLEDIKKAMDWMMTQYFEFHEQPTIGRRDQYLESIQQPTEIDVEIEMRNSRTGNIVKHDSDLEWDEDGLCDRAIPKLDSEGCLILKKI
jgi:hypothetical protein